MIDGFDEVSGDDGATAWIDREERTAVCNALLYEKDLTPLNEEGRGEVFLFPLSQGQGVFRRHMRGGFVRHFLKRSYVLDNRPKGELETHHAIWTRNLPVPRPLGALWRRRGPLFCGALATQYLEGVSLAFYLRQGIEDDGDLLRKVGETIAKFHDAGVYHADLNANNIVFTDGRAFLIDLDRARMGKPKDMHRGAGNLNRLHRSFRKLDLPVEGYKKILLAYSERMGMAESLAPRLENLK